MYLKSAIVGVCILTTQLLSAQVIPSLSDTIRVSSKKKNLHFSILGGPGYTPDYGFLVGGAALFTFSTDPNDPTLQRSVFPFSFGVTFADPVGISFMVKPQIFFHKDKVRLLGTYLYKNTNDNYYGVGYETNKSITRDKEVTQYFSSAVQLNPILVFRLSNSNFFIGPMADFLDERISKPGTYLLEDPLYLSQGGDAQGLHIRNMGLGLNLSYDTRDVAANAYKGVFFELKTYYYSHLLGSDFNYGSLNFDYRQYLKLPFLGERRVLSWTINSKHVFGDIPFTRYALIGNPFDLRGYYQGQYRNKSTLVGVAEYRHMFNFGNETRAKRFFSRFGFATWAGAGMMGSNPVKYEALLPNFGAGLRIELQPRMNFRLDVGYSPIDKQKLIYFNMTEAF